MHNHEPEPSAERLRPASSDIFASRVRTSGTFLAIANEKFYVRGVTYGPFGSRPDGSEYHTPAEVNRDFARMEAIGINAVRVYTVPPRWLLDIAQARGLRVMVGLPWEQHITFLDSPDRTREIVARVRQSVRACAGHPAVLCYAIGNEIPASIVRWHGRKRIERFLHGLYCAAKEEDPGSLATYVNYPTTEYLQLPFVDFFCFNVYLEARERLEAYLARLHNIAGNMPVVLAEVGLDSRRNGLNRQASTLTWQVRSAFEKGCAGVFVFSWTDEWHRGGYDIEDWDFGIVTRSREPKPALTAVKRSFACIPFRPDEHWPKISVVVCTYNGSNTIRETLRHTAELEYPDYETIVVNDGSTDRTAEIVREFRHVRLIEQANGGLSSARNAGMRAAAGEIIAYIDDDAYPDRHWLYYLAQAFRNPRHAAAGGPNLPPPDDGPIAQCVANAPGGPTHVLLTDEIAEHIPGCNFAVRKSCLEAIGGFDPAYRVAGDDVDVCWKLQEMGWTLGFHPAAVVWHHRRNSVAAYWKQQRGYGRAEALLERRWPEKYNILGHVRWDGRMYGGGLIRGIAKRWRIYHGVWAAAPFQSLYERGPGGLQSCLQMPEWHLGTLTLALLSIAGAFWTPLLACLPLLALAIALPVAQAAVSASHARFHPTGGSLFRRGWLYGLVTLLCLLQPVARLRGRLEFGLTPWRQPGAWAYGFPRGFSTSLWSERWRAPEEWLATLEAFVKDRLPWVWRGGDFDDWDLRIQGGPFVAMKARMAVEEHGAGKQLLRFRAIPAFPWAAFVTGLTALALAIYAAWDGATLVAVLLAALTLAVAGRVLVEWGAAKECLVRGLEDLRAAAAPQAGSWKEGAAPRVAAD